MRPRQTPPTSDIAKRARRMAAVRLVGTLKRPNIAGNDAGCTGESSIDWCGAEETQFQLTAGGHFDYCLNIEMNLIFKALDDGTRRAILDLLRRGDLAAGAIADHFEVS